MFLVFFFFKQKTAYEITHSDWSSDVCSSDLEPSSPVASAWPCAVTTVTAYASKANEKQAQRMSVGLGWRRRIGTTKHPRTQRRGDPCRHPSGHVALHAAA